MAEYDLVLKCWGPVEADYTKHGGEVLTRYRDIRFYHQQNSPWMEKSFLNIFYCSKDFISGGNHGLRDRLRREKKRWTQTMCKAISCNWQVYLTPLFCQRRHASHSVSLSAACSQSILIPRSSFRSSLALPRGIWQATRPSLPTEPLCWRN